MFLTAWDDKLNLSLLKYFHLPVIALLVQAALFAQEGDPVPKPPFSVGEDLNFSINWVKSAVRIGSLK